MVTRAALPMLILLASQACVQPTPTPSLADLNRSWVGRPWTSYVETYGQARKVVAKPGGGQVASYFRERTETISSGRAQVVNVRTGERRTIPPGSTSDTASQQFDSTAMTSLQKEAPVILHYTCTTMVHVDAQGRVERIERSGSGCE